MRSSTLFLLFTAFLIALSFSVADAGEEGKGKEEKGKEESKEGSKEDSKEGSEEPKEGGEEKNKDDNKSGALSVFSSNALFKAASIAIACLLISIH